MNCAERSFTVIHEVGRAAGRDLSCGTWVHRRPSHRESRPRVAVKASGSVGYLKKKRESAYPLPTASRCIPSAEGKDIDIFLQRMTLSVHLSWRETLTLAHICSFEVSLLVFRGTFKENADNLTDHPGIGESTHDPIKHTAPAILAIVRAQFCNPDRDDTPLPIMSVWVATTGSTNTLLRKKEPVAGRGCTQDLPIFRSEPAVHRILHRATQR